VTPEADKLVSLNIFWPSRAAGLNSLGDWAVDVAALTAGLAGSEESWHPLNKNATDDHTEAVVIIEVRSRFSVGIMGMQEKHYPICCNELDIN